MSVDRYEGNVSTPGESIEQFRAVIRNASTRYAYERCIIGFLKHTKVTADELISKAKSQPNAVEKILSVLCICC